MYHFLILQSRRSEHGQSAERVATTTNPRRNRQGPPNVLRLKVAEFYFDNF